LKHLEYRLEELLKHPADTVANDRVLLIEMLSIYSEVFLNKQPCSTCEKAHTEYYNELLNKGLERIKKNNIMAKDRTCKLKEGELVFWQGNHYTNDNITDKIANAWLKSFPGGECGC
jgi:hypothetical protein